MRKLHITNAGNRNATVGFDTVKASAGPRLGLPSQPVTFRRYLATSEAGTHDALTDAHGEDYAQALIEGDPEIDLEQVGRAIGQTQQVYLSGAGEVMHAPPRVVEVIYGPDGAERERRDPQDTESNVNDEQPVRWSGKKMSRSAAVHRFVFTRTLQIKHVDGLSYDYLHGMAKELDQEDAVVLLGSGPKGVKPLVFLPNGTPFRGFLEGRVDGARYKLLLHLSNMELKRPEPAEAS